MTLTPEERATHKEKVKKRNKENYKKNREEINKKSREKYQTKKEEKAKYYKENKSKIQERRRKFNLEHGEERREDKNEKNRIRYHEDIDRFREYYRNYYLENKENASKNRRDWYEKNKEEISVRRKELRQRDGEKEKRAAIHERDKEKVSIEKRNSYSELKGKMFELLGNECVLCSESSEKLLTIDHINGGGRAKRKKFYGKSGELRDLKKRGWPLDEIKENYQILCFNHNCSKNRTYLNEAPTTLSIPHRTNQKLWKEAFNFFGPCKICGESDLKFLTIDHIHDNGARERAEGKGSGIRLLRSFRKLGWPESLKEDYQFLCYNHNCSKHL